MFCQKFRYHNYCKKLKFIDLVNLQCYHRFKLSIVIMNAKVLRCFAQAIGLMAPVSGVLSYSLGETTSQGRLRAFSMATAHFIACNFKEALHYAIPETSEISIPLISGVKYLLTDTLAGKEFATSRFFFGAFNGFGYNQDSLFNGALNYTSPEYYHPKIIDLTLPIIVESSEAIIGCAIENRLGNCQQDIVIATLVGIVIDISAETTYPATIFIIDSLKDTINDVFEDAHNFIAEIQTMGFVSED
jgi:hypothetical protein